MKARSRFLILALWAVVLAVGAVLASLPVAMQPRWMFGLVCVVIALGIGLAIRMRRPVRGGASLGDQLAAHRELPVILVVGPHAHALFPRGAQETSIRRDANAVWLRVDTPAALADTMIAVHQAHGWFPQAALIPFIPEANTDEAVLRREFTQWRRALADACQHPASLLRCHIAIYCCLSTRSTPRQDDVPVWYGDIIDMSSTMPSTDNLRQRVQAIRRQLEQAALKEHASAEPSQSALGNAMLDWIDESAMLSTLAPLANTPPLALHGLLLADVPHVPSRQGAWTHWLIGKTGLQPRHRAASAEPLPLPDVVPLQVVKFNDTSVQPSLRSAMALNVGMAALALGGAFVVSGWGNARLIERMGADLAAYQRTPYDQPETKREALRLLERDRAELREYAQSGVPLGMGWGLYKGQTLQASLDRLIASYRPPPVVLTLDSLSLFDSGKTTLKAGATDELIKALEFIQSNGNKRILIAGHTDDVGTAEGNLRLSEARARAIRDWFIAKSSLPVTRFAIQGYGDTRPLDSNRSAAGRARNRRVEITLIPDTPAS